MKYLVVPLQSITGPVQESRGFYALVRYSDSVQYRIQALQSIRQPLGGAPLIMPLPTSEVQVFLSGSEQLEEWANRNMVKEVWGCVYHMPPEDEAEYETALFTVDVVRPVGDVRVFLQVSFTQTSVSRGGTFQSHRALRVSNSALLDW
jgi:hypothetical protein